LCYKFQNIEIVISMKITESRLRYIIKNELLAEGEVIPMDFRSKRVRKTLMPQISDCFIFSGDAGQIANVIEMQRDSSDDGGVVSYESMSNVTVSGFRSLLRH